MEDLPQNEKDAFREASKTLDEETLLHHVKEYDDKHKELSSFRPRVERARIKISESSRAVHGGVAISIQPNPDTSALVVGAVRILVLDLALRFVTFFTRLTDMLSRLSDYLEPLAMYPKVDDPNIVRQTAAAYGDLLKFCKDARRVFIHDGADRRRSSIWTFIPVQWGPFEAKFGDV